MMKSKLSLNKKRRIKADILHAHSSTSKSHAGLRVTITRSEIKEESSEVKEELSPTKKSSSEPREKAKQKKNKKNGRRKGAGKG